MADTTAAVPQNRGARWGRMLLLAALIAGILLGSATTAVVWAAHQFSDVPDSNPFHADIDWAADNGIVAGFTDGTFRPNAAVTRAAAVAFLHRFSNSIATVHHAGTFTNSDFASNTVTCPTGTRPIAGGGSTNQINLFITDVTISSNTVSVRWESDNNTLLTGTSDAWATCIPG